MAGYDELSVLVARFPELLIVRRFDQLSAKVVLALQSELLYLEKELSICAEEDEKDAELSGMAASWGKTRTAFEDGSAGIQKQKFQEVREKLREYHETLLRINQVQRFSNPTQQNRWRLWDWFCSSDGGDNFLRAFEASPWDLHGQQATLVSRDLVTLKPGPDALDTWLADSWVPKWHLKFGHKRPANVGADLGIGELWEYKMKSLQTWGNIICVILSALVPAASIQGLYWIPNTIGRLIAITGFIFIFAAIMMFTTECRRFEVFAATAAFAAVQVVFLQGLTGAVNC